MRKRIRTKTLRPGKRRKSEDLFYPPKSFNITVKQQEFIDSKAPRYAGFNEAAFLRKVIDLGIKVMKEGAERFQKVEVLSEPSKQTVAQPALPLDLTSLTKTLSEEVSVQMQRLVDRQGIALQELAKKGTSAIPQSTLTQITNLENKITELSQQNQILINLLVQTLGTSNVSTEMLVSLLTHSKLKEDIKPAQERAMQMTQQAYTKAKG